MMTGDARASQPTGAASSSSPVSSSSVHSESHSKMAASLLSSTPSHPSYVLNGVHPQRTSSLHVHQQLSHHVDLYPIENGMKKGSAPAVSHKRKRQQLHGTLPSGATLPTMMDGGNSADPSAKAQQTAPYNSVSTPAKPLMPPKVVATDTAPPTAPARHGISDTKRGTGTARPVQTTGRKYAIGTVASKTVRATSAQITAIPVSDGRTGGSDVPSRTCDGNKVAQQAPAPGPTLTPTPSPSPTSTPASLSSSSTPAVAHSTMTNSVPRKEAKSLAISSAATAPSRTTPSCNYQHKPGSKVSANSAKLLSTVVSGMLGTICSYVSQYGTPQQVKPCRAISQRIVAIQEHRGTAMSTTGAGGEGEMDNSGQSAATDKDQLKAPAMGANNASSSFINGNASAEVGSAAIPATTTTVSASTSDSAKLLDWIDIAREVYNIAGSFLWKHALHHFRQSVGPRLKISETLLLKSLAALDRAVRTHRKATAPESSAEATHTVASRNDSTIEVQSSLHSESAQLEPRTVDNTTVQLSPRKQPLWHPTQSPNFAENFLFPGSSQYFSQDRQVLPPPRKKRPRKSASAAMDEANVVEEENVAARSAKPAVKARKKGNGAAAKRKRRPVTQDGDDEDEEDENDEDDARNTTSSGRRRRQPKYLDDDRGTKAVSKSTSSGKVRKSDSQNRATGSRGRRRPVPGQGEDAGTENAIQGGGKGTGNSSSSPSRRGSSRGGAATQPEQAVDVSGNAQMGTVPSPTLASVASTDPNAAEKIVLSPTELAAAAAAAAVAAKAAAKLKIGCVNGDTSLSGSPRTRRNAQQSEEGYDNPI